MQRYEEGLNVGYRGYEHRGIAPRFAFGHGLSYGDAIVGRARPPIAPTCPSPIRPSQVTVPITATRRPTRPPSSCRATSPPIDPKVERPPKELRAFAKLVVEPGTGPTPDAATLTFDDRAFARWDTDGAEWVVDRGDYDLVIAASAADERSRVRITVT